MWYLQQSNKHQGLLWNFQCVLTVVLRLNRVNFKSAVKICDLSSLFMSFNLIKRAFEYSSIVIALYKFIIIIITITTLYSRNKRYACYNVIIMMAISTIHGVLVSSNHRVSYPVVESLVEKDWIRDK